MNGLMNLSLLKVDEERRLVIARAAAEEPDRSGEIMDWATAKPEFQRWSNSFVEATGGLSKGNVRLQHDPKHVAGKVVDISFDDTARAVDVVVKVVDDQAWKLCKEGCITGISIGGSYGTKWTDEKTGLRKYTPKITEISLVDNPCIPSARIVELVKADGSTEMMKVSGRARSFAEVMAKAEAAPAVRDFFDVLDAMPRSFDEVMEKTWLSRMAASIKTPRPKPTVISAMPKKGKAKSSATKTPESESRALVLYNRGLQKASYDGPRWLDRPERGPSSIPETGRSRSRVFKPELIATPPRGRSAIPNTGGKPRSNINLDALSRARDRMASTQAGAAASASRWGKAKRFGAIGAGVAAVGAAGAYAASRYRQDGSGMGKSARSFDEVMEKASWRDQPREHTGGYATKTGDQAGRALLGAGGAVLGAVAGRKFLTPHAMAATSRFIGAERTLKAGRRITGASAVAGGVAGGAAGYAVGREAGYQVDEIGRKRRANRAERREAYDAMKAKIQKSAPAPMQKGLLSAVTSVPGKIKGAYTGAADMAGKVGGRIAAHRISSRVSGRLTPMLAADFKAGNMGAARARGAKYASRVMKPASAAISRAQGAGRTAFHIGAGGSAAAGAGYLARGSQDTSR